MRCFGTLRISGLMTSISEGKNTAEARRNDPKGIGDAQYSNNSHAMRKSGRVEMTCKKHCCLLRTAPGPNKCIRADRGSQIVVASASCKCAPPFQTPSSGATSLLGHPRQAHFRQEREVEQGDSLIPGCLRAGFQDGLCNVPTPEKVSVASVASFPVAASHSDQPRVWKSSRRWRNAALLNKRLPGFQGDKELRRQDRGQTADLKHTKG